MLTANPYCTQAHLDVAMHLLRSDFGPVVANVCGRLLSHGAANLSDLSRGLGLGLSQLRDALLVLLQQNLVKCVARTAGGPKGRRGDAPPPAIAFYEAQIDEVLVRRWFPRMLLFVRERFNMDAEVVLQELMTHGRLSSELLVQHAVATYSAER